MNNSTLYIEKTRGYKQNYMMLRVSCDIYSVVAHGKLVIRTSNRHTALHYYALYSENNS